MTHDATIDRLIEAGGTLYSEEAGANLARDTPQELFHWLLTALMLSARIGTSTAIASSKALRARGQHKIDAILGDVTWDDLVKTLTEGGYTHYRENTATYITEAAELVRDRYDDDLRRLRDEANDRDAILEALQEVKGIGELGAAIFAREAQIVWDPLHPTLGGPAEEAARELGLPHTARGLSEAAGDRERFVRLVAALTRASIEGMPEGLG